MKKIFYYGIFATCAAKLLAQDIATNLEEALTKGNTTGHIALYGHYKTLQGGSKVTNTKGESKNSSGLLTPSASILYESVPLSFINVGMGAWANTSAWENVEGDYDGAYGNGEGNIKRRNIVHQLYAQAKHPGRGFIKIGRQDVDLEWVTDYIQGAVLQATPMNSLTFTALYANRQATIDVDEVSRKFGEMNGKDGVYGLDISYKINGMITINPYYYYAKSFMQIPGIKAVFDIRNKTLASSTTLHYALGVLDSAIGEDGYFMNIEEKISLYQHINLGAGLYKTSKDGGSGAIQSFGDHIIMEEGNHIFDINANTFYGFAEYEYNKAHFAAYFAHTKYDSLVAFLRDSQTESELDIVFNAELFKNLEAGLVYVRVGNSVKSESYNMLKMLFAYNF